MNFNSALLFFFYFNSSPFNRLGVALMVPKFKRNHHVKRTDSRWINAYYSCSMVTNPVLPWWKTDMRGKWSSIVIVKIRLISFRLLLFFLPFSISIWFRWFRFATVGFVFISFSFRWFRFVFVDFVSFRFVSFCWFRFVSFCWFRFVSFSLISFRFVSFRFVSFLFRFALYRYPVMFVLKRWKVVR